MREFTEKTADFTNDHDLGYEAIRWKHQEGDALLLDEAYRTNHLPLIDERHQDVIPSSPDGVYRLGRYEEPRYSLVLPISAALLASSQTFTAFDAELKETGFQEKVAWDVMARRQHLLHATICGGLSKEMVANIAPRLITSIVGSQLKFRVGGPLMGMKNVGRLYFPVFPLMQGTVHEFHRVQDALSRQRTHVFLLGYYNLSDHLDSRQARALAELLKKWEKSLFVEASVGELWIIKTNDDLVLSGSIEERLYLG